MGKWRQGLKKRLLGNKVAAALFNLKQEFYPGTTILFKKKFAKSAYFHKFASFQVNNMSTLWPNGDTGLKSTAGNKVAGSTL